MTLSSQPAPAGIAFGLRCWGEPLSYRQNHLGRVLQIVEEHLLHLLADSFVLDDHIEFPIAYPTRRIEIGRADPGPAPVGDRRLRVNHRAVPLINSDAGFE